MEHRVQYQTQDHNQSSTALSGSSSIGDLLLNLPTLLINLLALVYE